MYVINVCGNLCSGKTTMCKNIADAFGFEYIHADIDPVLIEAFLRSPSDYFLQQQLTLVMNKVMKIINCMRRDVDIVVDRSFYEDIEIFAEYFFSDPAYRIGDDVKAAYTAVVKNVLKPIPPVDLAVYCYLPPDRCEARKKLRARNYERFYPQNYIHSLHELYERKMPNMECGTLLKFDGTKHGQLDEGTVHTLLTEISAYVHGAPKSDIKLAVLEQLR